jgi:hypothetical protein
VGLDDELRQLQKLRAEGLLTPREFARAKARLVGGSRRSWFGWPLAVALIGVALIAGGLLFKQVQSNQDADQLRLSRQEAAQRASAAETQAAEAQASASAAAQQQAQASAAAQASATQQAGQEYADCRRTLGSFVSALDSLRVEVYHTVFYNQYIELIQTAELADQRVVMGDASIGCINSVLDPAESALQKYEAVEKIWRRCPTCVHKSLAQTSWDDAWDLVFRAKRGLRELQP